MGRRRPLLGFAACLVLLAACGPGADQDLLTDPRAIVGKTIAATATIKTVRIRVDFTTHANPQAGPDQPVMPQPEQSGWVELTADAEHQAYAARAAMNGLPVNGELILIGNVVFLKEASAARWTRTTMPGGGGMPALLGGFGLLGGPGGGPNLTGALVAMTADNAVKYDLRGVEDCRTGRCYRTAISIPPEVLARAATQVAGNQLGPVDMAGVPVIGLELLIDTRTLRLVDALVSGAAMGSSATFRIQLAGHDEPVAIQAPNPALVDEQNAVDTGGGSSGVVGPASSGCVATRNTTTCTILNEVGPEVSPEPSE